MWYSIIGVIHLTGVYARNLECGKPADVFFLLDSSGSLSTMDFQKEIKFTKDVISMLNTGENNMHVGVATFSKNVTSQVELGGYEGLSDLLDKISTVTHEGQGTNTGEALSYLHLKGMSQSNVREGLPHIAIVLTDGMSQNPHFTLIEAEAVHESGITVFVIGVGKQVDEQELEAIASKPTEKFVYLINNFAALDGIKEELAYKACKVEAITRAPDIQSIQAGIEDNLLHYGSCTPRHSMDLVFAVDTAVVGSSNARFVLEFIGNVSDHINMETGGVSIATMSSGCAGGTFEEDVAYDPKSVKNSLFKFESPKFPKMMRGMRLKAADGRRGTKHVGVIFMVDPLSSRDFRYAQMERRRAMYQKTEIFVFGVGDRVDESQARRLTTEHGDYIHVYSFDSLSGVGTRFLYQMCILGL